ncbi:MAG: PEP-CTERM sorting domain-containing protein [Thermoguttaceae bacterium]|nr:PEP-CTERM sorting domain-containing protein [Thermoguttaceae bacterium]
MKRNARKAVLSAAAILTGMAGSGLLPLEDLPFAGKGTENVFLSDLHSMAYGAPLTIGTSGDSAYTRASLNSALSGYDSLTKEGTGTVTVTLDTTVLATNSILVQSGNLTFTNSSPNNSTHNVPVFTGTIRVDPGAELFLNAKDALGYAQSNDLARTTYEIAGTLRLRNGVNQTMRTVTLDLQGGTVTGGEFQYRSPVTEFKATSGDSTFASTLRIRSDAPNPVISVSQGASLTFTGAMTADSAANVSLTFDGEGTTKLRGAVPAFKEILVKNGTLDIAADTVGRNVAKYSVSENGTLYLSSWDTLGATGNAVTFDVTDGTLQLFSSAGSTNNNQTGRNLTINLTGGEMKEGALHVFSADSNPTVLNVLASDKTSTISTALHLRTQDGKSRDHVLSVVNGSAAVDLELTGELSAYQHGPSQYVTFSGDGTGAVVRASGSSKNVSRTTIDGLTLQLGKSNALTANTDLVTNGTLAEGEESNAADLARHTGVFDLAGFDQTVGNLSGSGTVTNSNAGQKSTLTVNSASTSENSFTGIIQSGVDLVKTGSGTWTIDRGGKVWGIDSFRIQEGTVKLTADGLSGTRFIAGEITVAEGAVLQLEKNDVLGGAGDGNWENAGLDLNIFGTVKVTASGNQTSRYVNLNLYGGTLDLGSGQFLAMHSGTTPITTLNAKAQAPDGTSITKTSVINGIMNIRDSGRQLILNVEDSQAETDLWWTGALKYSNNANTGVGEIVKNGAGTLRLSSNAAKNKQGAFDNTGGITANAGTLVLDGANVTGGNVTIGENAVFRATDGASISKSLLLNGTWEFDFAELADSEADVRLLLSDSITFGSDALLSFDAENFTQWELLDGIHLADFTTEEDRDKTFAIFSQMLEESIGKPDLLSFYTDGNGIAIGLLQPTGVPEPSTWVLGLLGMGALGLFRVSGNHLSREK